MTHTHCEDTEKITMAPIEEDAGFDTCNTTNMVAEPDYDFTAKDSKKAEKDKKVNAAIAQSFIMNVDDMESDEKGLGKEITLKDIMGKLWNLALSVKQPLPRKCPRNAIDKAED